MDKVITEAGSYIPVISTQNQNEPYTGGSTDWGQLVTRTEPDKSQIHSANTDENVHEAATKLEQRSVNLGRDKKSQGLRTSHNLDTVSSYTRSNTWIHGPVSSRTRSKNRERKQDYVELVPDSKRLKVDRQLVRKPCKKSSEQEETDPQQGSKRENVDTELSATQSKNELPLKTRVNRILNLTLTLPPEIICIKDPLHTYESSRLSKELQKANISHETYLKWQTEATNLQLEADPVITAIRDENISDHLVELQKRFFEEGAEKFACEEFKVTLRNIITCIDYHLKKDGLIDKKYLKKLKKDVTEELAHNKPIVYSKHLILCARCAALISLNFNNTAEVEYKTEERQRLTDFLDKISWDSILKLPELFQLLPTGYPRGDFIKEIAYCEYMFEYIKFQKINLMWPCFDILDLQFFVQDARYLIKPAGLCPQHLSFHDWNLMSPLYLFGHDFFHELYWHGFEKNPQTIQKILVNINIFIQNIGLDNNTITAIWLLLFDYNHEANHCLTELEKEGFKASDLERLAREIISGRYEIDKSMTVQHIHAAYEILRDLFPEPSQ